MAKELVSPDAVFSFVRFVDGPAATTAVKTISDLKSVSKTQIEDKHGIKLVLVTEEDIEIGGRAAKRLVYKNAGEK